MIVELLASPTPPSAFVAGGSAGDSLTAVVVAAGSSPPSADAAERVAGASAGAIGG